MNFTRIKNDYNGNPRYVVHFLECRPTTWEHLAPSERYDKVVKLMSRIGGKRYHNKSYGGGIVFQSYSLQELETAINRLKENPDVKPQSGRKKGTTIVTKKGVYPNE